VSIKAALCAVVLGLGSTPAWAQTGVPFDLMPPYEAARIVRSTGFIPVAVPMRWGASYVVRAIDRYGIPVRVVIDGRDGDILAVRRIAAVQPPGYPYPPGAIAPRQDPYASGPAMPPGYPYRPPAAALRTEPPYGDRQAPAVPRIVPNAATPNPATPPSHSTALTPARPPVPRARPSAAAAAEAAVKPPQTPDPAPTVTPPASSVGEQAPARPAGSFPPVQPLE
jgi:hypothetical protein